MGDLFVLLKRRKALTEKHVRDVVIQLVTAVVGLHRNNICHRDIKPENVLLERSGLNPPGLIFKVMLFSSSLIATYIGFVPCLGFIRMSVYVWSGIIRG